MSIEDIKDSSRAASTSEGYGQLIKELGDLARPQDRQEQAHERALEEARTQLDEFFKSYDRVFDSFSNLLGHSEWGDVLKDAIAYHAANDEPLHKYLRGEELK